MLVRAQFHGLLAHWITGEDEFCLPAGARLQDLLAAIGRRYGETMPTQLWDRQRQGFAPQVAAFTGGSRLEDPSCPLQDGQQIRFMLMLGGG